MAMKKPLVFIVAFVLLVLGACDTKTEEKPQDIWVKTENADGTYCVQNMSPFIGTYSDLTRTDAVLSAEIFCSDECRFAIELRGVDGKTVRNDKDKKVQYIVDIICSKGDKHKCYAYMFPGEDRVKLQRPDDYWVRAHLAEVEWFDVSIKKASNEMYSYNFTVKSSNLSSLLGEE